MLDGRGEAAHDEVEDQLGAHVGGRDGVTHDRVEVPAGDGPLQVGREEVDVDVLAADEALHQRLVLGLGDDALDELAPCGLHEGAVLVLRGRTETVPELQSHISSSSRSMKPATCRRRRGGAGRSAGCRRPP